MQQHIIIVIITFNNNSYNRSVDKNTIQIYNRPRIKSKNWMKQHVQRVKNKYGKSLRLKTVLPSTHVFVQMDFIKDYECST